MIMDIQPLYEEFSMSKYMNAAHRDENLLITIQTLRAKVASAELLLVAAKHIQGILQHPTRSVTILDAGRLDDAISAYEKLSETNTEVGE